MLRDWLLSIPYIGYTGYLFAFLAAVLEAMPVIGLFIPGQTIVVIAGFLAHQGILNPISVILLAIIGAILGDFIGYWLGKRYGISLFKKQRGIIKEVMGLLKQHPFKTLVVGRFNSLTRAFGPFAAGAIKIRSKIFWSANIIGGILWGITWVAVGFIFGASYELASKWVDIIIISTFIIFAIVVVGYRFLKRKHWLARNAALLLFLNIVSLATFTVLLESVRSGGYLVHLDTAIHEAMPGLWNNLVTIIMVLFTSIIQPLVITAFTLCIILLLALRKDYSHAVLVAISMIGATIIDFVTKVLIMRPRPIGGLLTVNTYSFPSGHAFLAVVFFGALILSYTKHLSWKKTFVSLCVFSAFMVAISRIYLGVHWVSDVLAGVSLGIFWLTFVYLGYEGWGLYKKPKKN